MVGTISVEASELVHNLLVKAKIPHEVLNAKNHAREAEIIAKAGQVKAVTVATNMAGRGTDIKLSEESRALGGLAVLGSDVMNLVVLTTSYEDVVDVREILDSLVSMFLCRMN